MSRAGSDPGELRKALGPPEIDLKDPAIYKFMGSEGELAKLPDMALPEDEYRWVGANMIGTKIKLSGAPSRCAVGLLQWARGSAAARGAFWEKLYSKQRAQGNDDHEVQADVEKQSRLMQRMLEAAKEDSGNDVSVV
jgi:hypothetical protein